MDLLPLSMSAKTLEKPGATTDSGANLAPDAEHDALRKVAEQFEALFAHMLLKNMRSASLGDGLFDSEQGDLYQDMMDQEMAGALSKQGGLGIADMLVKQLGATPATQPEPARQHGAWPAESLRRAVGRSASVRSLQSESTIENASGPPIRRTAYASTQRMAAPEPTELSFETPEDFVRAIWPLASQAAATMRVSPEIIVAQAALETGWGQHPIRDADGKQANNLFGIKAGASWRGDRVEVPTTEVLGGVARKVVASFRSYGTLAESVADYTRLIMSSPRYRSALNTGGNAGAFAGALQQGGYATDPAYAAKILAIANGDTLKSALESLKVSR